MSRLYFDISEFVRRPDMGLPVEVADRIARHHLWPMNPVRAELGAPVSVSLKSGYRPVKHETERGRSGESEHTFRDDVAGSRGWGAADYTTRADKMGELARLLVEMTEYTRIVIYPDNGFIHCDYKFAERGRRTFIGSAHGWNEVETDQFIKAAQL